MITHTIDQFILNAKSVRTIDQFILEPKSKQGESWKIRKISTKIEILEFCYKLNTQHTL